MDGYVSMCVWVSDGGTMLLDIGGKLLRWDFCTVSLEGGQWPPRQQQLPLFWQHKTKWAPSLPPASGPPSLPQRKTAPVHCTLSSIHPSIPLHGAVCSAKQNNVKQSPNYPGLTAFTCDPHSLDEALTNRVGIKPICLQWSQMIQKKKNPKTVTDWSFDHLLGTLGPLFSLNAYTALTHLSVWACKDVICIMVTQYNYCTCETAFLLA